MAKTLDDYQHIQFRKCWSISDSARFMLGQCVSMLEVIGQIPVPPKVQHELRKVAFERGAQATTAIEGNTLTDGELQELLDGKSLPKSREYQGKEVQNALNAMKSIADSIIFDNVRDLVTVRKLCEWNKEIGKDLGPLYDGVPGRLRRDRRHVGRYLAPPHEHVPELLESLCVWLRDEFRFEKQPQRLDEAIIEAVVAHVFFEWIHPFADGNGRTGRLLEFYILLRAGFPNIAAHIMANHYNQSRAEYSANFDIARRKRNLTGFIEYAIQGLYDGLKDVVDKVLYESRKVVWETHIYRTFADYDKYNKISIFKRRRMLALSLPIDVPFTIWELISTNETLAKAYLSKDRRTINADMKLLLDLKLVVDLEGPNNEEWWMANVAPLMAWQIPKKALPVESA